MITKFSLIRCLAIHRKTRCATGRSEYWQLLWNIMHVCDMTNVKLNATRRSWETESCYFCKEGSWDMSATPGILLACRRGTHPLIFFSNSSGIPACLWAGAEELTHLSHDGSVKVTLWHRRVYVKLLLRGFWQVWIYILYKLDKRDRRFLYRTRRTLAKQHYQLRRDEITCSSPDS